MHRAQKQLVALALYTRPVWTGKHNVDCSALQTIVPDLYHGGLSFRHLIIWLLCVFVEEIFCLLMIHTDDG